MAVVAVVALPVTEPTIGFVTVRLAKVPTLVKLLVTTVGFSVVPVKVPAAAVTVIGAEPSKFTPLIVFPGDNFVAVAALPVIFVWSPVLVPERFDAVIAPVNVLAPPIVWAVVRSTKFCVAEPVPPRAIATSPVTLVAVPVTEPTIGFVTVRLAKVPTLVKPLD